MHHPRVPTVAQEHAEVGLQVAMPHAIDDVAAGQRFPAFVADATGPVDQAVVGELRQADSVPVQDEPRLQQRRHVVHPVFGDGGDQEAHVQDHGEGGRRRQRYG